MAFSTGEVIPTPHSAQPFKVVFATSGEVIGEWPVSSVEEGEKQIIEVLKRLRELAEDEGYV